jgi:CBS domain-containing protein
MTITAGELMTSPVFTTDLQASVAEVADLLVDKHVSAIPVCKPDGSLAGIISEADVVRPFRESAQRKRKRWLDLLSEGEALSQDFLEYLREDTKRAADLMARHVVTASRNATLAELAELMISHGVKRIPIVDGGKVVGIVSRSDLVRGIAMTRAVTP